MKVIGICGSPRNGNTEFMLRTVLDSAKKAGAETELILLREKDIHTCDGCDSCYGTGKGCHIQDDMQEIYKKIIGADTIVLASPNYFDNVSGIMKNFIDRTNAYCLPPAFNKFEGKNAAIVCAGAESPDPVEKAFMPFINHFNMKLIGKVLAKADKREEIKNNKQKIQECIELGRKIVS
jgi:multimeric flavodoxin WrbA